MPTRLRPMLLAAALAPAAAAPSSPAFANDPLPDPPSDEIVLMLARVCMSEADMHEGNDCAAIAEVTRNRARRTGRTLLEQLRAYSPEATGTTTPRARRQRWISTLQLDGSEPSGWAPMNAERVARGLLRLPWTRYGFRWTSLIREARSLLTHPRRVCAEPPHHWGGDCNEDANPHGVCDTVPPSWRRVSCGRTVNAFYTLREGRPVVRSIPAHRARGGRSRR